MVGAIGDSLSDLASSDDRGDGEDEGDEETEHGKLSEDDVPGWVIGTVTKTVPQRMQRFRPKQLKLDELSQPGWEDAADYFCGIDDMYGESELRVSAIVQPQTDDDAEAPARTTSGEFMECLEIVHGILQMPHGSSWPGSCHIRLGSVKLQLNTSKSSLEPAAEHNMSSLLKAKPVEPASFYPRI